MLPAIASGLLLIITGFATETRSQTNASGLIKQTITTSVEPLTAQIIKVYSAQDGESRFRAYVVKWKGQEVIVSDLLVMSDKKAGDAITFIAHRFQFPRKTYKYDALRFDFIPNGSPSNSDVRDIFKQFSKADIEKLVEETEIGEATVVKVYSAQDGEGRLQDYIVKWNGQEVVIPDVFVMTDYKAGDSIEFTAQKYPIKTSNQELLQFLIVPPLNLPSSETFLEKIDSLWLKKDLTALTNNIESQYVSAPAFVPGLLAKAVTSSLIEAHSKAASEILKRMDNLIQGQHLKSYDKFLEAFHYAEEAVSAVQDKDQRVEALFLIFRNRFPLAERIEKVRRELQITQDTTSSQSNTSSRISGGGD